MSRMLLAICSFALTVGLIAFVGGDVGASDSPGPSCTRPGRQRQIIQVAKKKPRAKKAMKKEDAAEPEAKTEAAAPAGKDDTGIKFSRDVAPIFVANCVGCHSEAGKTKGQFDLSTFERLMKGSAKEKVIEPGDPEKSELVLRVKGESASGKKMPPGAQKNLGENAISRIEQWVKSGARLDAGLDAKSPLASYATSKEQLRHDELAKMKPAERDKLVETVGLERWKLASPKVKPEVTPGKTFIMFSSLPKNRVDATLKAMDGQVAKLRSLVGRTSVLDWVEKPSLFVFNDRNGFVEFVRNVERREVEEDDRATSSFGGDEPYIAVVDPLMGQEDTAASKKGAKGKRDEEGPAASRSLAGILTEQLAVGVLSKAGKPPRWLSLGLGAYMEAQIEGASPYIGRLRSDARQLAEQGWTSKAIEAMGDQTKSDEVRAVGYAIVDWLAKTDARSIAPFVQELLKGGEKLDDAIANVLMGTRDQFLQLSGDFVMAQYGGRKR